MRSSVVVLAGGFSKRFGRDKGLVELKGKPLAMHLLEKIGEVVEEKVIVVGSEAQKSAFMPLFEHLADVIVDKYDGNGPLIGALTGFETVRNEYTLLLPCDTPLISGEIAALLLDCSVERTAAIPRWPNGWLEPLQAAYHTKSAIVAAKKALEQGEMNMRSMIDYLHDIRYISTLVLRRMDAELLTFFNINTIADLRKAESMLDPSKSRKLARE
ncbi:MAG: molybdenum cofactor guanylyltransferase [Candidatus Bathyarchaeota archaeon]